MQESGLGIFMHYSAFTRGWEKARMVPSWRSNQDLAKY